MLTKPGLVAFDVDGTLLRGETICECIARNIGKSDEMSRFERLESQAEIAEARVAMAKWYAPHGKDALLKLLPQIQLAPGAKQGIANLQEAGIEVALVSITWSFAVEWIAKELKADYAVGTDWLPTGEIAHFWPEDKATWLAALLKKLDLTPESLTAVGDSKGDIPMLKLAGKSYYVGQELPKALPNTTHIPNAPITDIAAQILKNAPKTQTPNA